MTTTIDEALKSMPEQEFTEYIIATMGGGFGGCDRCQNDALTAIRTRHHPTLHGKPQPEEKLPICPLMEICKFASWSRDSSVNYWYCSTAGCKFLATARKALGEDQPACGSVRR